MDRQTKTAVTLGRVCLATVSPKSHRTAEENLGLGYLASVLRRVGHSVYLVDGWLEGLELEDLVERIVKFSPNWVGFSCYRSNIKRTHAAIQQLRARSTTIPVVAGGYGPTFYPLDFLEAGADFVAIGEAEETVVRLTSAILQGRDVKLAGIPGLAFLRDGHFEKTVPAPLIPDLDRLPFPARDTLPLSLKRKSAVHIVTSRGCAAHCHFCSIVAFMRKSPGKQWRQRTIADFVDEVEDLAAKGVRVFKVIDDSLIEAPRDAGWAASLATAIHSRGLAGKVRFRGSIRADRVSEGVIGELARAGFFSFSCGIENFSESALRRMNKTATLQDNTSALEIFRKYDLLIQAGHILFDHGTTLQELRENQPYLRKYIWTVSKGIFSEMFAAEGTPFAQSLARKALLRTIGDTPENYSYEVQDPKARLVYDALKMWHKHHMALYDMAIDPISAPKALADRDYKVFRAIARRLRERDLDLFDALLSVVEGSDDDRCAEEFVRAQINCSQLFHDELRTDVDSAYRGAGLLYDAEANPFVC